MHISKKILVLVAGSALAATMTSCGGGGSAGSTSGDTLTVGIKYDQPGLGQKVGEDFKGSTITVPTGADQVPGLEAALAAMPKPDAEPPKAEAGAK